MSVWNIVILFGKFKANKTTKLYINSPAKKYATKSYILDITTLDLFEKKKTTTFYPNHKKLNPRTQI
jgi:hypothetical protein